MLSHDSMTYAARQNMALFGMEYSKETTVSYLPQVSELMDAPKGLKPYTPPQSPNALVKEFFVF